MSSSPHVARFLTVQNAGKGEFSAKDRITAATTPEIVIALCGPLGSPLHRVADILRELLKDAYDYKSVDVIRLSEFIRQYGTPDNPSSIRDLIDSGNELRAKYGASLLAQLAIRKIAATRERERQDGSVSRQLPLGEEFGSESAVVPSPVVFHCHIIDSIKNSEELDLLRSVYGRLLHVISVYAPIDSRIRELERKLGDKSTVYELIDRDSGEEIGHGQSVRNVFPQADFFLRVDSGTDDQIVSSLKRYFDLLFGARVITPTQDERAMYEAHSAARNSACLSRQVGAAISDAAGTVISVGWNDVPRAFGGLYESSGRASESSYLDHRCWNKDGGKCFNDEEKTLIASSLTDALVKEGIIEPSKKDQVFKKLRRSSELRGLIEFSRAVHAEMHAILSAGISSGSRIKGGKLYVTTYPCHSCARHLIAAGITEVKFIEPYRKSLATRLHSDSITESESDRDKVRIVPFDGVAPSRFLDLFSGGASGRKDAESGRLQRIRSNVPVTAGTLEAVTTLEALAIRELHSKGLVGVPTLGEKPSS